MLDCGGHSALSKYLSVGRGIRVGAVQLLQSMEPQDALHWERAWAREGLAASWLANTFSYHEAIAVIEDDGSFMVWDPSEGAWLDPHPSTSYAGILAARLTMLSKATSAMWGDRTFENRRWEMMPFDRPG
jgi:hypothetical protein